MLYNNDKKAWEPAEGIRGMSYIQVYHHEGNNTFRIVGRSMTDHQVVSGYFCIGKVAEMVLENEGGIRE